MEPNYEVKDDDANTSCGHSHPTIEEAAACSAGVRRVARQDGHPLSDREKASLFLALHRLPTGMPYVPEVGCACAYVVRHTVERASEPIVVPFGDETSARAAWLALLGTPGLTSAEVERTTGDHRARTRCEWSHGGAGFRDVTREHWQATRELAERLSAEAPAGYGVAVLPRAGRCIPAPASLAAGPALPLTGEPALLRVAAALHPRLRPRCASPERHHDAVDAADMGVLRRGVRL
jgi:hypothetical protein